MIGQQAPTIDALSEAIERDISACLDRCEFRLLRLEAQYGTASQEPVRRWWRALRGTP